MSFFDAIRNVGSTAINQMQELPGQIANAPSNAMARIGTNVDFMKALTQNPEEFEKFMLENPDFFKNAEQVGIPELPQTPFPLMQSSGLKINQMPNYLNSAQQVLTRG